MPTVKAKDLQPGMIVLFPDVKGGSAGYVTISQIDMEAAHIVAISYYYKARYYEDLYHPEAEFELMA